MSTNVRYSKLSSKEINFSQNRDGYSSLQFKDPPKKVPWRALLVALVLFMLGTVLLIVGILLLTGYIDTKYSDRTWPVLTIGLLTFIPGFYHVRIAYYAWLNYEGYSFDDIPDYND